MASSTNPSESGNSQMPFNLSNLRNISRNLQEVVNETLNSDSVMDFRKTFKKNCNSCGNEFTSFALFSFRQEKKRCQTCMLNFCSGCMFSTSSPRKCRRCSIFNQTPITKEGLNSLRVRDLKWFLAKRNIPSETCNEKRELVDLIFLTVRRTSSQSNSSNNSNNNNNNTNNNSSNIFTDNINNVSIPRTFRDASDRSSFSEATHSSSFPSSPSHTHPEVNFNASQQESTSNNAAQQSQQSNSQTDLQINPSASNLTSTTATSTPNLSAIIKTEKFEFVNLDQITEESQIHALSIRQLKVILARNYVDFRGCIEREELVQRTLRLWNDHQKKQKYMEENEHNLDIDPNACSICMDRPIDCVLLECGHMVTCTECGKQLPQCPICRQFVSRVVHVFKS